MADRQFDLGEIKAHLEGPTTSPLFLLDACRWLVDEVEKQIYFNFASRRELERRDNGPDLKRVLMELGNRLVTDHGWEPVAGAGARTCGQTRDHTGLVAGLTQQINDSPAMREVLTALGFDWPIIEEDE